MGRRKRKMVSEINLTPLLDVLFSILFIVMMTGMQKEKGLEEDYHEQLGQMQQEISELSGQVTGYEYQMAGYDKYHAEAVVITVSNTVREGKHYLLMKQGMDLEEIDYMQLGVDRTENTAARIHDLISGIVEVTDNQPVYIVFYCDKKNIYTLEYRAIEEAFQKLQINYKEVFFKVMEVDQ